MHIPHLRVHISSKSAKVLQNYDKLPQIVLYMIRKLLYFPKNQRRGIFLLILIIAIAVLIAAVTR